MCTVATARGHRAGLVTFLDAGNGPLMVLPPPKRRGQSRLAVRVRGICQGVWSKLAALSVDSREVRAESVLLILVEAERRLQGSDLGPDGRLLPEVRVLRGGLPELGKRR